jgi:hypothetical protein
MFFDFWCPDDDDPEAFLRLKMKINDCPDCLFNSLNNIWIEYVESNKNV